MPGPLTSAPWPYNPAGAAPRPASAYVIPPSTQQMTDYVDRFGPKSQGAKLAEWMKGKRNTPLLPALLRKAALPTSFILGAKHWYGTYGLQQYINGHPLLKYGSNRLWGWTKSCDVGALCAGWNVGWWDRFGVCRVSCAVPAPTIDPALISSNPQGGTSTLEWGSWIMSANPALAFHSTKQVWVRNANNPTTTPIYTNLRPDPGILPNPFPEPSRYGQPQPGTSPLVNVLPELQPVQGLVHPAPLPFSAPRPSALPGVEPTVQPRVWPPAAVRPVAPPAPRPGVAVAPNPNVNLPPNLAYHIGPTRPIRPGRPEAHKNNPPNPRARERKWQGKGAAGLANKLGRAIVHYGTETLDVVDAAWHALPEAGGWQTKKRGEYTTPQQKVRDVVAAFSDDDFNSVVWAAGFVRNAALNELEDKAYGKLGKAQAKSARAHKKSAGIGPHGDLPFGYTVGPAL